MTDKPPKPDNTDKLPEAEAEARFNKLVGSLVNTPHKPHVPAGKKPVTKSAAQKDGNDRGSR